MAEAACHHPTLSDADKAIAELRRLTPKRVAGWCDVTEFAVHQWMSRLRSGKMETIPLKHLKAIQQGARAEKVDLQLAELWPGMPA